jgi:hypothetical protein
MVEIESPDLAVTIVVHGFDEIVPRFAPNVHSRRVISIQLSRQTSSDKGCKTLLPGDQDPVAFCTH